MLKFLETFDRRSWRCGSEAPFLVPLPKDDLHQRHAFFAGEERD